jgi:hypothetical protein
VDAVAGSGWAATGAAGVGAEVEAAGVEGAAGLAAGAGFGYIHIAVH